MLLAGESGSPYFPALQKCKLGMFSKIAFLPFKSGFVIIGTSQNVDHGIASHLCIFKYFTKFEWVSLKIPSFSRWLVWLWKQQMSPVWHFGLIGKIFTSPFQFLSSKNHKRKIPSSPHEKTSLQFFCYWFEERRIPKHHYQWSFLSLRRTELLDLILDISDELVRAEPLSYFFIGNQCISLLAQLYFSAGIIFFL